MKKNEIQIVIGKAGGINIDVVGGQGTSCTNVTKELEIHLSNRNVSSEGKKPEYFDPDQSAYLNIKNP